MYAKKQPRDISIVTTTMSETVAEQLQQEWRSIVLTKLDSLDRGQKDLKTEIGDIKSSFASQKALETMREHYQQELDRLRDKVENLEGFKSKAIGIILTIQFLTGLFVYWLHATAPVAH